MAGAVLGVVHVAVEIIREEAHAWPKGEGEQGLHCGYGFSF